MSRDSAGLVPAPRIPASRWRRVLAAPAQGWTSLLLLAVMLGVTGLAVDASMLAATGPAGEDPVAFAPALLLLSGGVGFLLARLPVPVGWAHLVAAILGAVSVLVASASVISDAPALADRLEALNGSAARQFQEIFIEGASETREAAGRLLALGAIAWTTGQFAAFNLFRRGTAMAGVVASGALLLVVLSLTPWVEPLYAYLVVFCGAALLLGLRVNLWHQQAGWRRRHIVDGQAVSGLFLQGGALVVTASLAGAVLLAASVSAAPLADGIRSVDDRLVELVSRLDGMLGGLAAPARQASGAFGETTTIQGRWIEGKRTAFVARTSDGVGYYWRGAAYDRLDGATWSQSDTAVREVARQAELLAGSVDSVGDALVGREDVTATISVEAYEGSALLAPDTPLWVDRDSRVALVGDDGPFALVAFRDRVEEGGEFVLSSRVLLVGERRDGITENRLAMAGYTPEGYRYPAWVKRYTQWDPASVGDRAAGTAREIRRNLPEGGRDPYHVADAIEDYLSRSGGFRYETDVTGACLPGVPVPECLMLTKAGYCQHYATTMVMMLRSLSIPSRYVEGFLPGQLRADGSWVVPESAAHAWAEVYFPDFGWVRFDPTPPGNAANGQVDTELPPGRPGPTPQPLPSGLPEPSPAFGDIVAPSPSPSPSPGPGTAGPAAPAGGDTDPPWPLLLVAAGALLLGSLVVGIARLRRLPGREPDLLYRGIASLAKRFGYGPRPDQTAYEFSASLSDVVPGVARELHVVAHAKVEATYGRRKPEHDALDTLVAAYRRVRAALWRLVVRRPRR